MYEPYFHFAVLVRNVEAARANFTAKLGVQFEPVHSSHIHTGETIRYCYSYQGPPYIELAEMTGTGSWSTEQPEGFHHIGLTDPNVPGRCRLFGEGVDVMGADSSGELIVGLTPPEALHGIRVEYFDTAIAAQWTSSLLTRVLSE
jgi:hypothetical protein